jgi:hypothetical protein
LVGRYHPSETNSMPSLPGLRDSRSTCEERPITRAVEVEMLRGIDG